VRSTLVDDEFTDDEMVYLVLLFQPHPLTPSPLKERRKRKEGLTPLSDFMVLAGK
jgi:hypothetical protein